MPGLTKHDFVGAATRRHFLISLTATLGFPGVAAAGGQRLDFLIKPPTMFEQVTPEAGIDTGVHFGDAIQKLIAAGVLVPEKLRSARERLPHWVERLLAAPSAEPIVFRRNTASYLVDLLWPVGLATKRAFNDTSPMNTLRIPSFSSTGGWTLGRERNGYVYFNTVDAIELTAHQELMVLDAAASIFRPCCNNSTLFQDCNHGSALLGLIELAASQGASVAKLYEIGLAANSYWFPNEYAKIALYFSHFKKRSWREVSPRLVLGPRYSALSGWTKHVELPLWQANVSLPPARADSSAC